MAGRQLRGDAALLALLALAAAACYTAPFGCSAAAAIQQPPSRQRHLSELWQRQDQLAAAGANQQAYQAGNWANEWIASSARALTRGGARAAVAGGINLDFGSIGGSGSSGGGRIESRGRRRLQRQPDAPPPSPAAQVRFRDWCCRTVITHASLQFLPAAVLAFRTFAWVQHLHIFRASTLVDMIWSHAHVWPAHSDYRLDFSFVASKPTQTPGVCI